MGICSSCLRGRDKAPTASESTPLLYDQRSTSLTYTSGDQGTPKNQLDLAQIVQATQQHLIDITTMGQPDLDVSTEIDAGFVEALAALEPIAERPEKRALREEEAARLNEVHKAFLKELDALPRLEAGTLISDF